MANRDMDLAVLSALKAAGSDLTKPAHIIHLLYFKTMDDAEKAAGELRAGGYEKVDVQASAGQSLLSRLLGKKQYSCFAETRGVPSESNVLMTTKWMETLAGKFGGEYDGWEASVER